MKKTIAILLVLVIAMAGVFADIAGAASSTLNLTTQRTGIQYLAITASEFEGNTLALWNTANATSNLLTADVPVADGTLAWLNLINNNRAGVDVYVSATQMASTDTTDTSNTYKIDYAVSVGEGSFNTASNTEEVKILSAANTKAVAGLFMESYAITAVVDSDDFEQAPADTYRGIVTFNFASI